MKRCVQHGRARTPIVCSQPLSVANVTKLKNKKIKGAYLKAKSLIWCSYFHHLLWLLNKTHFGKTSSFELRVPSRGRHLHVSAVTASFLVRPEKLERHNEVQLRFACRSSSPFRPALQLSLARALRTAWNWSLPRIEIYIQTEADRGPYSPMASSRWEMRRQGLCGGYYINILPRAMPA